MDALVSVHEVGELIRNANVAPIGKSIDGATVIALKLLLKETPDAIVVPSGRPARVNRWTSMVTGPWFGHEMLRSPMPVNWPCAPTVTVCAIRRPPSPPNEIAVCVAELPC